GVQHGASHAFGGGDGIGGDGLDEGDYPAHEFQRDSRRVGLRRFAMHGADGGGPKHVGGFEGHAEQGILGGAFDAGPGEAAAFGGVRAFAGDVDEGHAGVLLGEGAGGANGEVVGDSFVVGGAHAGGGDAEAEESGVETREFVLHG